MDAFRELGHSSLFSEFLNDHKATRERRESLQQRWVLCIWSCKGPDLAASQVPLIGVLPSLVKDESPASSWI